MVGNDDESPPRTKPVAKHGQGALEARELIVDGDPERLEQPGKVARTAARPQRAARSRGGVLDVLIQEQLQEQVVVAVGGGGLMAGVAAARWSMAALAMPSSRLLPM